MKLHEDADTFQEFMLKAAEDHGIPEAYVEKDYWVTLVLFRLACSDYRHQLVFKGGTSLSKIYGLISRFSEDVDLAVSVAGMSQGQVQRLIREASKEISRDLEYLADHPDESKHGSFRKTYHRYPRRAEGDMGHVSSELQLELNAFAAPNPSSLRPLRSMVADWLQSSGNEKWIDHFELQDFELKVLSVERTLTEKIMGLVKASHEKHPVDALKRRIRHVYDLCLILRDQRYERYVRSDDYRTLLADVCRADRKQFGDKAFWLETSPATAALFQYPDTIWPQLAGEFKGAFSNMVFNGELPAEQEVTTTLRLIGANSDIAPR